LIDRCREEELDDGYEKTLASLRREHVSELQSRTHDWQLKQTELRDEISNLTFM